MCARRCVRKCVLGGVSESVCEEVCERKASQWVAYCEYMHHRWHVLMFGREGGREGGEGD